MRHSPCCLSTQLSRLRASGSSARGSNRPLTTLAIETSCDDTAVAVLSRPTPSSAARLLFNERVSSDSRAYGGVVPIVAVRGHSAAIAPLMRRAVEALERDGGGAGGGGGGGRRPDIVAVTRGPGMMANLSIGISAAKGLAVAWGVPLVAVHHMQAHALTPRLVSALGMEPGGRGRAGRTDTDTDTDTAADASSSPTAGGTSPQPEFPFLSLLVSGGHTQLVHSATLTDHRIVAATSDNAIGNLLDQAARVILPADLLAASPDVMYGRQLEAFAFPPERADDDNYAFFRPARSRGDEIAGTPTGYAWAVPQTLNQTRRLAYSFGAMHSTVHRIAAASPRMGVDERRALARHLMASAFAHLAGRLCVALEDRPSLRPAAATLVVAGGVASNRFLMHVLRTTLAARGYAHTRIVAPPAALCTDNAAMIAWAGMEMYEAGYYSDPSVTAIAKWPMDPTQGVGILGVDGWLRRDGF